MKTDKRGDNMSKKLDELKAMLEKEYNYAQVITLLYWDMRTGMPKEGFKGHADALTYFSTENFKMSTDDKRYELLEALVQPEEFEKLDDVWKFSVKKMKDEMDKDRRIPAEFFEKYTRVKAETENAWEEAKQKSDYSIYAPHLKEMIEMTKQFIAYREPEKETYDALLNLYEEGMDSKTIDGLFNPLKEELVPFVKEILAVPQPDSEKFHAFCDKDAQKKVQELLLTYMGYDWSKGSVAESEHPFTLNFSANDVRITNHYKEHDAIDAMFSAIHEGGHGLFEQGVNPDFYHTAAGQITSLGVHESQSRFYENILGRNMNFWVPIYEKVQELLPAFKEISLEEFYREVNHVKNGFIRTESDEVTYCFHIILRYEIEKEIFRNHADVDKLPELWNQKMQEYLGITPKNDAEGILQDMHWSDGSFGYFPTYLLGSIYDGMYLDTMREELGDVDALLKENKILEIKKWLNEKIHVYGGTRTAKETIQAVCKKEISAEPLMRYFKEKYTDIYNL